MAYKCFNCNKRKTPHSSMMNIVRNSVAYGVDFIYKLPFNFSFLDVSLIRRPKVFKLRMPFPDIRKLITFSTVLEVIELSHCQNYVPEFTCLI